jgi:hypothetical protein
MQDDDNLMRYCETFETLQALLDCSFLVPHSEHERYAWTPISRIHVSSCPLLAGDRPAFWLNWPSGRYRESLFWARMDCLFPFRRDEKASK